MLGEAAGLLQPAPRQQADGQEPQDLLGVKRQHRLPLHHHSHAVRGGGQVGLCGEEVAAGLHACCPCSPVLGLRDVGGGCGAAPFATLQGDEHAGGQ